MASRFVYKSSRGQDRKNTVRTGIQVRKCKTFSGGRVTNATNIVIIPFKVGYWIHRSSGLCKALRRFKELNLRSKLTSVHDSICRYIEEEKDN